jgi:hypothetical protein
MLEILPRRLGRNKNNSNYFLPPTISGELHGDRTAVATGITAHGYAPALALCRKLVAACHDPRTRLELFRKNGTLALRIRSIGEGAQLRIDGDGTRFERLPDGLQQRRPAASPMQRNEPVVSGDGPNPSNAPDDGCPS